MLSGTTLVIQQLRFHASTAEGMGLIPGQGTKTPHAKRYSEKTKQNKSIIAPSFFLILIL